MGRRESHWPGRAGFAAKGILYGIIGIVAIAVALGSEKSTADQTGALASLADSTGGKLLLILLAAGLGGYALFRLAEVFEGPALAGEDAEGAVQRVASLLRFVIYGALCVSAVRLVVDAGGSSGGGSEKQATSTVFDLPAGVALVAIAGVALIGVALYQAYQALTTGFEEDLQTERMSPRMRKAATWTGTGGHAARTVIYLLIGGFLIKAAAEHDSKEAVGIDGALQEVAQQSFGPVLLFLVAAGLFVYGAYCLIEARYHRF